MMASGSDQLSYCAASTRKTNSTDRREDEDRRVAGLPLLEGELGPFEAHALAAGLRAARLSMASSAVPDDTPGAALPCSGTDVYML